jgi:DNA-binding Lrp family transcriptional regulator
VLRFLAFKSIQSVNTPPVSKSLLVTNSKAKIAEPGKSIGRNSLSEARAVLIRTRFSWKRANTRLVFPHEAVHDLIERVKNLPADSAEARITFSHHNAPEKDARISLWGDKRFSKTLKVLKNKGPRTLKQIACDTVQSMKTVAYHCKKLVNSGEVKRIDLRLSLGYPRNVPKVFYQIDTLRETKVRFWKIDLIVRKSRRFDGIEPVFQKRLTPFGRSVVDEKAWFTNHRYKIKRPWTGTRAKEVCITIPAPTDDDETGIIYDASGMI